MILWNYILYVFSSCSSFVPWNYFYTWPCWHRASQKKALVVWIFLIDSSLILCSILFVYFTNLISIAIILLTRQFLYINWGRLTFELIEQIIISNNIHIKMFILLSALCKHAWCEFGLIFFMKKRIKQTSNFKFHIIMHIYICSGWCLQFCR